MIDVSNRNSDIDSDKLSSIRCIIINNLVPCEKSDALYDDYVQIDIRGISNNSLNYSVQVN